MASTTLDFFMKEQIKPPAKVEVKAQAPQTVVQTSEPTVIKHKKRDHQPYPPIAPENLPPSYFVSASYDGRLRKAVIKLYEPGSGNLYYWYDNTGHLPYCVTNLTPDELERFTAVTSHPGFERFQPEKKFDPLNDKFIDVTKIVCKDPLAIGGRPGDTIRDIIPADYPKVFGCKIHDSDTKIWESKIK